MIKMQRVWYAHGIQLNDMNEKKEIFKKKGFNDEMKWLNENRRDVC